MIINSEDVDVFLRLKLTSSSSPRVISKNEANERNPCAYPEKGLRKESFAF